MSMLPANTKIYFRIKVRSFMIVEHTFDFNTFTNLCRESVSL